MFRSLLRVRWASLAGVLALALHSGPHAVPRAAACGGFFCQAVPIDQAGEQIIFRQDGDTVTAVVLIQYEGPSEDFSWVLPVPGEPEITLASDLVFGSLESATRPQFFLDFEGSSCPIDGGEGEGELESVGGEQPVDVLSELDVGPFAIQIVTSADPAAMAAWLAENNFDLNERGQELLALYIDEGMNFVAMKLRQNFGVGDIQPIKLAYQSEVPMIPIRLTAVAAVEDMGILVWLLGDSRAVPLNYPHVEVNYTRLNWFQGSAFAYADYQDLVTEAMSEVGGLGFATDYAGTDIEVLSQLPQPDAFRSEITFLGNLASDEDFYMTLSNSFVFAPSRVLEILRRQLPLPEGVDEVVYSVWSLMAGTFGEAALGEARTPILIELIDSVITPLENTRAVFESVPYMTRLFTTLSPEEMSLDPVFSFNPDLADQPLTRRATWRTSCVFGQNLSELILGEGTGRDGEVVIRVVDSSVPDIAQSAVSRSLRLTTSGAGEVETENTFQIITAGELTEGAGEDDSPRGSGRAGPPMGLCGLGAITGFPVVLAAMFARRRRRLG